MVGIKETTRMRKSTSKEGCEDNAVNQLFHIHASLTHLQTQARPPNRRVLATHTLICARGCELRASRLNRRRFTATSSWLLYSNYWQGETAGISTKTSLKYEFGILFPAWSFCKTMSISWVVPTTAQCASRTARQDGVLGSDEKRRFQYIR